MALTVKELAARAEREESDVLRRVWLLDSRRDVRKVAAAELQVRGLGVPAGTTASRKVKS